MIVLQIVKKFHHQNVDHKVYKLLLSNEKSVLSENGFVVGATALRLWSTSRLSLTSPEVPRGLQQPPSVTKGGGPSVKTSTPGPKTFGSQIQMVPNAMVILTLVPG